MGELDKRAHRVALPLFLSVLVFAAVSGCISTRTYQAYEGETLPKSKIAILRETTHFYIVASCSTNLKTIDGKDVNGASMVELLPGSHKVSFLLEFESYGGNARPGFFEFQAEAGHVYKLNVAKCAGIPPLQAWIEDKTTGKVVAGTKP
jgi:hypothetical protein